MTLNIQFGKIHRRVTCGNRYSALISVKAILVFSFLLSFSHVLLADETRPNVVLIVIDDLGWADLGCYGSKFHKTPNLDRLASDGMRFTQAYAAAPVGSPTRAAIMTGRYPQRVGITTSVLGKVDDPSRRLKPPEVAPQLPLSEVTIAEALKRVGYVTGSIGKWNLGDSGFGPKEQGFDVSIAGIDVVSVPYRDVAPYTDQAGNKLPGLEQAPDGEFLTDRLAAEAEKFITDHKSKPFFLYLPHFAVHMPANPKPDIVARYGKMPTEPNGSQ